MIRKQKYNAKVVEIDGIKFRSKLEADWYLYLKDLEEKGEIYGLALQPKFDLVVNGINVAPRPYKADFRFINAKTHKIVTLEIKGKETREARLRLNLARAIHNEDIYLISCDVKTYTADIINNGFFTNISVYWENIEHTLILLSHPLVSKRFHVDLAKRQAFEVVEGKKVRLSREKYAGLGWKDRLIKDAIKMFEGVSSEN